MTRIHAHMKRHKKQTTWKHKGSYKYLPLVDRRYWNVLHSKQYNEAYTCDGLLHLKSAASQVKIVGSRRKLRFSDRHFKYATEFLQRAANFQQKQLWMLNVLILPVNFSKMGFSHCVALHIVLCKYNYHYHYQYILKKNIFWQLSSNPKLRGKASAQPLSNPHAMPSMFTIKTSHSGYLLPRNLRFFLEWSP